MPEMISDPIEFELFKNSLFSIADEMALTIFRTTYSGVLKDNMDYSTAMFDGSGKLALSSSRFSAAENSSHGGPGRYAITPMSADGSRARTRRIRPRSTRRGYAYPPLKLFDRGTRNDTLWALIDCNVRVPVKVFGDLRAQLAACHISERSLIELAGHYGVEKVERYMTELIDYSERMTRAAIRELPDGVYSFLDHIDDDGIDVGKPIPLAVTVTKSGDQILVDWTGSSPQSFNTWVQAAAVILRAKGGGDGRSCLYTARRET
jgi:N-methylhydantoinase B